jgi:hypothetical protein
MKEWFKYEYGFVNIDDKYLYLTSSGNWSETAALQEKTSRSATKAGGKRISVIIFLVVMISLLIILAFTGFAKSIADGKFRLGMFVLLIGGGYKLYEYLKTEIGARFKIPLDKITGVRSEEDQLEIFFLNGDGVHDCYKLPRVEEKGKEIMQMIKPISQ